MGSYESGGVLFAKVSFPGSMRRIPMDQLERVPATREEPIELLRSGRLSEPRRLWQGLTHTRLAGRLADPERCILCPGSMHGVLQTMVVN